MYPIYVAILVFLAISLFVPFSLILTSIMLRKPEKSDPISSDSFESAEASTGQRVSIMNEYLHYFPIFLSFEVVMTIVIVWSLTARSIPFNSGLVILGLPFLSMLFAVFVLRFTKVQS